MPLPWNKKSKEKKKKPSDDDEYENPGDLASSQRPPPPPQPEPLFASSWRELEWSQRDQSKDQLRKIKLSSPTVKTLRILVHGPVGAGKSTFTNSIDSIFQNRMKLATIADAGTDCTFTKSFQVLQINDEQHDTFLPFDMCDTMGLENEPEKGVAAEDLVNVLKGHVRDGYKFNPTRPCCDQDREYNSSPTLADRVHCMVCAIPADKISMMEDDVIRKLRSVRAKAADMRIPQVVVLTNIDKACPEVAKDIKLVYRSKKIKEKMEVCSNRLGVPMNCIFPVKNYHEEIQLNNDIDVLLLSAMNFILHFANDHLAVAARARGDSGLARDFSSMNFSSKASPGDDSGHGENNKQQSGFYPAVPRY